MKTRNVAVAAAFSIGLASATIIASETRAGKPVSYPDGYRDWTHVKSLVLQEGHALYDTFGGIHHIYANAKAVAALKANTRPFPDGSVFVFDLLEANSGDHAIAEGPRKIVGVMSKNAKGFAATGGWGYEGFKADGQERAVTDSGTSCHACHASQLKNDYVFSELRK